MTSIYLITNLINNKVYVGQTKRNVHTRFVEHSNDSGSALYKDMLKYGKNSFSLEVLHICLDIYANQWERYYICKYDSTNPSYGYNKISEAHYLWKPGGENPSKTEDGKARIRIYNKEHPNIVLSGFRAYNNSRKFPVAMLDEQGNILKEFQSLSDACIYLNKGLYGTTRIKSVCDKFNKNGKRAKFFGYSWMSLSKGVQTNRKVEDELPLE